MTEASVTQMIEEALLVDRDGALHFEPKKLEALERTFHAIARRPNAEAAGQEVHDVLLTLIASGQRSAAEALVAVVKRVLEGLYGKKDDGKLARFSGGVDSSKRAPRVGAKKPKGALSLRDMTPPRRIMRC